MIVVGEHVCKFVNEMTGGTYQAGSGQGIGIEKDGKVICGVLFESYNGRSVQIHVACVPGSRMTKKWLQTLFTYAFVQLKVNKIIGVVDSTNAAALKFDRHIGFKDEAIIEGAGKHGDLVILSMTKNNCKYLEA